SRVVLIYGLAGSGKTATAKRFATWYLSTGGLHSDHDAFSLCSSFDGSTSLTYLLDHLDRIPFDNYKKISDNASLSERVEAAIQLFTRVPIFWIWDNVAVASGDNNETEAATPQELEPDLREFLIRASDAGARFLITSRGPQYGGLGDLP